MKHPSAFSLCVEKSDTGKRLDIFVSESLGTYSRSYISQLVRDELIKVCGQIKKPGYQVKFGDTINGIIPEDEPSLFLPEPMNLVVIYEDDCIIVIDKPPGLVVHPSPGHPSGTLVNGLLHHCPDLKGIGGEIRPGIVHRLDKDTSGVMVVAKNATSHQDLARQFKSRNVKKEYVALVYGELELDSGEINLPIGRHPVNRKKMSTKSRKGKAAKTQWMIYTRFSGFSLVKVDLKTGRTHQIRVHFSAAGHPIVGDPVYGGKKTYYHLQKEVSNILLSIKRQMLHSSCLTIAHPKTKKAMSFESPLPEDMADLIEKLNSLTVKVYHSDD